MKSVTTRKLFSFLLAMCMVLNTVLAVPFVAFAAEEMISAEKNEAEKEETLSHAYQPFAAIKEYQYSEDAEQVDESSLMLKVSANAPAMSPIPEELAKRGVTAVRVMVDVTTPEAMAELGVTEPYRWLMVGFEKEKATEVALSFAEIPYVLDAEYNYTRQSSELPSAEENPLLSNQWHLQNPSLQNAWKYLDDNDLRQKLSQVVVAVIDTGVDYTHPNLVNSMWVNVNEIPGDGIDNDQNGYCDDVYGISTLGNSMFETNNGDPMDEMGHGTHVAGIVAASEGAMGAVGVAYGAKIMAIKAGDSSGIFNDSDVIEGINYAILMGADVINMSFGSYARSAAIEDALALAYTSSVLVAAAGNDGLDIVKHGMPSYPAAYNFVIGVMATDANGNIAAFSNTDYILRRNSLEYEICAPGTSIFSTLPGNQYRAWSGTSMACPYISAVAAILRAKYDDKSVYSTRYIMGQLVGTAIGSDGAFPMVDPYAALTDIPEPDISYYDYYIFDDPAYSNKNNGDGIIDAGETIGLGVLIRNHWGQARNTKVKLIAAANATDATLCPYVTWITDTVDYGDVGTFNSANNGFSYDADGVITGISNPFMFEVSDSIPNDYHIPFALVIECESYTEADDTRTYRFDKDVFNIQVRKGYELPRLIDTDMTLTADQYYIISGSTLIESGVTVTVEPGTQIQFWGDYSKELYAGTDVAELLVDGELIIRGTAANPVDIFPSGGMSDMKVDIKPRLSTGKITMEYCNIANPVVQATAIDHCYFTQLIFDCLCELQKDMDGNWYHNIVVPQVRANEISNSIFYELGYRYYNWDYRLEVGGKLKGNLFDSCGLNFNTWNITAFRDNVFLKNYRLVESQIGDRTYLTSEFNIGSSYNGTNTMVPLYPVKNPETGSTYFVLHTPSMVLAEQFAKQLGGAVAYMDNEAEKEFLLEYAKRYYSYNEELSDYNWSPCLNYLYVGFYNDGENVTHIGEGNAEDWLQIPQKSYIPMISTSYYKPQDGEATREAWMSDFYSGDTYWMEAYLSQNPSTDSYRDRGVIIEIPGEITPLSVSLECEALTIPSNTVDYRVLASVYPETDHYTLSWSSDNEGVVKVSEDGKLTAVGVGTATVTVKVNGMELTDSLIVVVTQYYAPESISDTISEILLTEYQQTKKLSPVIAPAEATALITYSSSDTNVAMVGLDGTVTAISSGTAVITARVVGTELSYAYTVKVAIPPKSIALVKDYIILSQNSDQKQSLSYFFEPVYATEGSVEYLSSDESVVLVSETGELTPVSPGNAIVWVSFPEIDRAVQAKVIVVEDDASVNITSGGPLANWSGASVLYAEDGTTYLLMDEEIFGNSKLLQEFPYKTKGVTCAYSEHWFYIDMENHLRCINLPSNEEGTIIADGVSHVWSTRWSGYRAYYQKLDGTVWFYSDGTSTQNVWLENIVDGVSYNDNYVFLDDQGTLWYDKTPVNNDEPLTPLSFDATPYVMEKKIVFLDKNGCFDEEGTYYYFSISEGAFSLSPMDEFDVARLTQALKVTWDQVVDATRVTSGATNHWLLLLNDGRVVYAGYYYPGETNMLADLISIPSYSGVGYCFLDLGHTVASLGTNALIGTDGSVLTYIADYSAVLGNGKNYSSNQSLKRPVSPWIGTKDDGQNVMFDSVSFTDGQGDTVSAALADQAILQERVDPNSAFVLTLSKPIVRSTLTSFVLKDGFNNKVELDVSVDRFGKTLTVTPHEALRAGYEYTLSIPAGVIADEFGNTNRTFSFGFTVSGVAVYAVPVTGIIAEGKTEFSLEYGQGERLDTCVLPENASMQKVYWSSSNEKVATVNASGYVTGHQNGTATITATTADGGFTATFTVTVCTQPDTVSLYTGYFLLEVGEKGQMDISSYPDYADLGKLTYGSNRTDVVTVDENGVLTAVGQGSTLVYVTSSVTGESYYALVDVVEDSSFAEITNIYRSGNDTDRAYFIAEDNSVWYVTTSTYGNENPYIPRKASFKATKVLYNSYWNDVYYISLDGQLYRTESSMHSSWKSLIAEDVIDVVFRGSHVFYVKSDGSVYHYNINTNKATKCSVLNGTAQFIYFSEHETFYFLNQDGVLRYISANALESGVSNSLFKTVSIPGGEKIARVSRQFAFGVDGGIYRLERDSAQGICTACAIEMGAEYQAIQDRIVKMVVADMSGNNAFIALLDDGSVYFVGAAYHHVPIGLSACVDKTDISTDAYLAARPIEGVANVADLDTGYFLLQDGTVLAYQFNNYGYDNVSKMMLANNNMAGVTYSKPVVAWFGANGEQTDILFESAQGINGDASTSLSPDDMAEGLNINTSFVLTFNKQLYSLVDGISLIDMGGNLIPLTVTISERSLIITPKTALKEGTLYTLSIPGGSVLDIFQNTTEDIEINFTTTGDLHFEIPVEAITDTTKQVSLTYGEPKQLYPTILPANASMKRVSWTTSDPNVVTVTQDGEVTGVQNGTATVTVTSFDGDFTYEYTVTVYTAVDSFTISEEFVILDLSGKKTVQLVGSVKPSYLETDGLFTWSVADPDIATVDADGTVTALKAGVTAVYCYCEGFSQPMICIISVLSDYDDAFINRISQKYNGGFLFEADGCLWLVDSAHMIPEKLVFQKPVETPAEPDGEQTDGEQTDGEQTDGEQTDGEQTSEILQISDMKQVLYVPGYRYAGNTEPFLLLFLEEDGTLLFYFADQTNAPCLTKSGVKKIAYANSYLILLMEDGSLTQISVDGRYLDYETQTEQINMSEMPINDIAGIQDIVYRDDSNTLFLLQINKGLVWSYNPESGNNALRLVFSEEPITDITLGDGSFMRGESGKLYPLSNDVKFEVDELKNLGFYNLSIEIADVVNTRYGNRLLMLTTDGKLAYFGYNAESFPLAEQYSGYAWKQDASNSYLYYIETGKVVSDIGRNWILFADGTVKMFGEYTYLGNAKYTEGEYAHSLCSPYFTETDIDIHTLTLQKVTVSETEIDISAESTPTADPTKQIILEFSLPLVYTDYLMATTVQDSQNNCPAFDIKIDGRKLILIFEETLTAGETYTVTVYANAVQDIFHNSGEQISFTVSMNNTAATVQAYEESLYPTTEYSPDWTLKQLQTAAREFYDEVLYDYIVDHSENVDNAFLNAFANPDTTSWMNLIASESINSIASLIGNFWGTIKTDLIDRIIYDVNDSFKYGEILYDPILATASETAYPFVTSILVKNSEGNVVSSVGMEDITVEVYFNRDMDTDVQPTVAYGSDYPFGDFAVTGDWKDARTWVGTTKISAVTGSGTQFFKVRGAVAADDSWLVTGNDYERFAFTIATSGAKSMSMQANGADGYVALEWTQDDYETMAGYNVYRSEQPDGTYTKLNRTLISQDNTAYVDDNVDPGVLYYYYFTVVGTDLKESEPSGIAMASAHDTTPPTVTHTAVVQAPVGAAISIVANVYDNLNVASVKLYYRTKGQTDYSWVEMYCNANASGRYTATIPAGIVTADGVEYYIEASDGRQNGSLYNATNPQSVNTYQTYSITVLNVSGGRITISKTRAKAGDYITATAIAESGYAYLAETLKYTVDGSTYININDGFTMPEGDVTVTATFVEESGFAYGDLNRDGIVNSADAILLLRYDAGLETLDAEQLLLADVNRDGRITVYDANEILRIDVGL